jgi:hypothetical protein
MQLTLKEILDALTDAIDRMGPADQERVIGRLEASIELGATLEEADPTLACVCYHIGQGAHADNVLASMGLLDE